MSTYFRAQIVLKAVMTLSLNTFKSFLCGFEGQFAAVASCFRQDAQRFLNTSSDWKDFRLELLRWMSGISHKMHEIHPGHLRAVCADTTVW